MSWLDNVIVLMMLIISFLPFFSGLDSTCDKLWVWCLSVYLFIYWEGAHESVRDGDA